MDACKRSRRAGPVGGHHKKAAQLIGLGRARAEMAKARFCLFLLSLHAISGIISGQLDESCRPSSTAPDGRSLWTRPVSASTGRVLANAVGFVRLYGDLFTVDSYLPLKLNQATDLFQWSRDGFSNHELRLAGKCVVLALNYTRAGESVIYHDLSMHLRDNRPGSGARGGAGSTGDWRQMCTFSPRFAFAHAKARHYSCLQRMSHACLSGDEPVAELVLERFKFETKVGADLFMQETFDTMPLEESCSYW